MTSPYFQSFHNMWGSMWTRHHMEAPFSPPHSATSRAAFESSLRSPRRRLTPIKRPWLWQVTLPIYESDKKINSPAAFLPFLPRSEGKKCHEDDGRRGRSEGGLKEREWFSPEKCVEVPCLLTERRAAKYDTWNLFSLPFIWRSKRFNNQQGAYKMFIVPAKSLQFFFYLFDGSQVPLHDVIGKDAEQEGLYFLFTSVKEKKKSQAVMKHLYKRALGSAPVCLGSLMK